MNNLFITKFLIILILINIVKSSSVLNLYVDVVYGDDTNSCTSTQTACSSIQGTLVKYLANVDDTLLTYPPVIINMASGIYSGPNNNNINLLKYNIEFIGQNSDIESSVSGINAIFNISVPLVNGTSTSIKFTNIGVNSISSHPFFYYDATIDNVDQNIKSTFKLEINGCQFNNITSKVVVLQSNTASNFTFQMSTVELSDMNTITSFPQSADVQLFNFLNVNNGVSILNCNFTDISNAGVIYSSYSPLSIVNSSIKNSKFTDNNVITSNLCDITIQNSTFENLDLQSNETGAIQSTGINYLKIQDSLFNFITGNVITLDYSNAQIINSKFTNNYRSSGQGTVISSFAGPIGGKKFKVNVSLSSSQFINNTGSYQTYEGQGAAVYLLFTSDATINNCDFSSNVGGALLLKDVNAVISNNTKFNNNTGSIYCDANIQFKDSTTMFTSNNKVKLVASTNYNGITQQGIICNTNSTLEKRFNNCTVSGPTSYQTILSQINDICLFEISISSQLSFNLLLIIISLIFILI